MCKGVYQIKHGKKKAYWWAPDDIHALPDHSRKSLVLRTGHVVLSGGTQNGLEKDVVAELGTFETPLVGIGDEFLSERRKKGSHKLFLRSDHTKPCLMKRFAYQEQFALRVHGYQFLQRRI